MIYANYSTIYINPQYEIEILNLSDPDASHLNLY